MVLNRDNKIAQLYITFLFISIKYINTVPEQIILPLMLDSVILLLILANYMYLYLSAEIYKTLTNEPKKKNDDIQQTCFEFSMKLLYVQFFLLCPYDVLSNK